MKEVFPMRVLSFPKFPNRPLVSAKDWSQQEIADFYRAHRLLVENGAGIGIDRGISDIGEPWMVFFDTSTQDVFMHVARIGGRCVLICEQLGIHLKANQISDLIADFENAVRHHLAIRTERGSNVVIHPAARIIMSISMVFLLFKLDNSNAHAKTMTDTTRGHTSIDQAVGRSSGDTFTATQRAQNAFVRLMENLDTPTSAAILAGIILAGELAVGTKPNAETHQEIALRHGFVFAADTGADVPAQTFTPAENHKQTVEIKVQPEKPHVFSSEAVLTSDKGSGAHKIAPATETATLATSYKIDQDGNQPSPVAKNEADTPATSLTTPQSKPQEANLESLPQAVKVLEKLFGWHLDDTVPKTETAAKADTAADHQTTIISLETLDSIDDHVGFFRQTSLSEGELRAMIEHFVKLFDHYDIEYSGGRVLIEQSDMASVSYQNIGLWTNVMADGSSISVVGQANIVDDIAGILV